MGNRGVILLVSAVGFVFGLASPAEAAEPRKNKKPAASTQAKKHRHPAVAAAPAFRFHGGVPAGPLYNGQDYLGDDPDPNIRSQILRDMVRYGGPE